MRVFALLPILLVSACASPGAVVPGPRGLASEAAPGGAIPTGTTIGPSGYASVGATPPSAFPADPPPMPVQLDTFARRTSLGTPAEQKRAWDEANGSEEFQREFQRLRQVIARAEPGNFVDVRLVRDPGVTGEFIFRQEGAATLARYTQDTRFRAKTIDHAIARLERLEKLWIERIQVGAPVSTLSRDTIEGRLQLEAGIEEGAFRDLARSKSWEIDDPLLAITYPRAAPPAFASPDLARLVRAFAREDVAAGIRLLALSTGRIVLADGCFRLGDEEGAPRDTLVIFARTSQLVRDSEGYLAVHTGEDGDAYRIGERGAWGGPNAVDEASPEVRALRQACGPDPIINVASPQSERLFALPDPLWVLDYAHTRRITYGAAWDEVVACLEKQERSGRQGLEARDRCIRQYNGWDYTGEVMPPPPGGQ